MNILETVRGRQTIAISGHIGPDGDCVGSCLGMALYLRKNMPEAQVDVYLGDFSDALRRNIPGTETIIYDYKPRAEKYDAFIALDCGRERLGDAQDMFDRADLTVNIDHHVSNPGTGMINFVDGNASSACEMAYLTMNPDLVDRETAQALYVGMVTDTGVFRYSNTSERTMQTAGRLMTYGFDYPAIVREVFYEKTFTQQKLLGIALERARSEYGGLVIASLLDWKTQHSLGAAKKDIDGISAQLALTEGADCAILLYATATGEWKGSLRSNRYVDVAAICQNFRGGGHVRAAGCTMYGDGEKALEKLIGAAGDQLRKQGLC